MGERPAVYGLERDQAKKIAELDRQLAASGLRPADLFFSLRANGSTWEYIEKTYGITRGTVQRVCTNQEVFLPENDQVAAERAGKQAQEKYGGSPGLLREMWYKLRAQGKRAKSRPGYRRAVELTGEQWELSPQKFVPEGGSRCSFYVNGERLVFDSPQERENGLVLDIVLKRMGEPGLVEGETYQVPFSNRRQPLRADFRVPHVALLDYHEIQRDERESGIRSLRQLRELRLQELDRPDLISHHYIMYDKTEYLRDILNDTIFPELAPNYSSRLFREGLSQDEFDHLIGSVREAVAEHDIFENQQWNSGR